MFYIFFISYIGLHADYIKIIKKHLLKSCVGILNSLLNFKMRFKQFFFTFPLIKQVLITFKGFLFYSEFNKL